LKGGHRGALANLPGTIGEVELQNNGRTFQYEPWGSRHSELMGLSPDSPAYRKAAETVDDVLAGRVPDPTGGSTHFYAPVAQAMLGRSAPSWGRQGGTQVGATRFFSPDGTVDRTAVGLPSSTGAATWATLDETGVTPRNTGSAPSQPKVVPMPTKDTAAADGIMAMYGLAPTQGKAPVAAPAPVAVAAPKAAVPAAKAAEDDIMALYGLTGEDRPHRSVRAIRP
jgi:hypothetical protein